MYTSHANSPTPTNPPSFYSKSTRCTKTRSYCHGRRPNGNLKRDEIPIEMPLDLVKLSISTRTKRESMLDWSLFSLPHNLLYIFPQSWFGNVTILLLMFYDTMWDECMRRSQDVKDMASGRFVSFLCMAWVLMFGRILFLLVHILACKWWWFP